MLGLTTLFFSVLAITPITYAYKDYDNDFLDPSLVLAKNFSSSTAAAQQAVVQWADYLAVQGPWCEYSSIHVFRAWSGVDRELFFFFLKPL